MQIDNLKALAILFSDIKSYSEMDGYDINKITELNNSLENELKTHSNFIFFKSIGDGLIIAMDDSVKLAEFAMKLRDKIRNTCWIKEGMANNIQIRIGLHFGSDLSIEYRNNEIKDITGTDIIYSSRIEPITTLNDIFCSEKFFNRIRKKQHKIKCIDLGNISLAKNYGKANLYKLCWDWEYDLINNSNNNSSQNTKEKAQQSTSNNQDDSTINISSNTMELKFDFINNRLEINKKEKEIYFKNNDKKYIGRSSAKLKNGIENEIILPNNNKSISRFHGYFEIENRKVKIVDWDNLKEKKSENGIIINGTKIDGKEYVSNGDLLKFGNYEVLIYLEGEDTSNEDGDKTVKTN